MENYYYININTRCKCTQVQYISFAQLLMLSYPDSLVLLAINGVC